MANVDPWDDDAPLFEDPLDHRADDQIIALASAFLSLRNFEGWGAVAHWFKTRAQRVLEAALVASTQEGYKSDFWTGRLAEAQLLVKDMEDIVAEGRAAIQRRAELHQELVTSRHHGSGASEVAGEFE